MEDSISPPSMEVDVGHRPPLDWSWHCTQRRKLPDDPMFEEGDTKCHLVYKHVLTETHDQEEQEEHLMPEFPCQFSNCGKVFNRVASYEMHYNIIHRNVCRECHRIFPTNHLLEVHLQEWHNPMFDQLSQKTPMFQCLVDSCGKKFMKARGRRKHLIEVHKYPTNFRFDQPRTKKRSSRKPGASHNKNMGHKVKQEETMDTGSSQQETQEGIQMVSPDDRKSDEVITSKSISGRRFVYKVPKQITFGQGVARGFHRPRGKKAGRGRHWHQTQDGDTAVNIEEVHMRDLEEALDS